MLALISLPDCTFCVGAMSKHQNASSLIAPHLSEFEKKLSRTSYDALMGKEHNADAGLDCASRDKRTLCIDTFLFAFYRIANDCNACND